jgi:hypothetical protein
MQKHRRSATPAKTFHAPTPAPYTGSGTEVVDSLEPGAVHADRLLLVAAWHDQKYGKRNAAIAAKLRQVAANDNRRAEA